MKLCWTGRLPKTILLPAPLLARSDQTGAAVCDENGVFECDDASGEYLIGLGSGSFELVEETFPALRGEEPVQVGEPLHAPSPEVDADGRSTRTIYDTKGVAVIQQQRRYPNGSVRQLPDGRFEILPEAAIPAP